MDTWEQRCRELECRVKELERQLAYAYSQIQSLLLTIEQLQKENKELGEKLNTSSKK